MKLNLLRIAIGCLCLTALAAIIQTKISSLPQITSPSSNTWFEVADMNAVTKSRKLAIGDLKSLINATNVNGSGTANTMAKWSGTTTLTSLANGPEGYFLGISNGVPTYMVVSSPGGTTNIFDITIVTNSLHFNVAKGGTVIVTNYIRMPWATLTISGTNASAPSLTNASVFKLTMTTNVFVPAPTDLPGTNTAQTIQIAVKQDSGAVRTLTWNSAYKFPGGTAPTLTTNANAVDVFSFVTSPFDATVLYSVAVQNF